MHRKSTLINQKFLVVLIFFINIFISRLAELAIPCQSEENMVLTLDDFPFRQIALTDLASLLLLLLITTNNNNNNNNNNRSNNNNSNNIKYLRTHLSHYRTDEATIVGCTLKRTNGKKNFRFSENLHFSGHFNVGAKARVSSKINTYFVRKKQKMNMRLSQTAF